MMEIYPAIDLMNREVVRLRRGKSTEIIRYNHLGSPLDVARKWERQGAEMIHVIDLDATLRQGNNQSIVNELVEELSIPIQFGGGIRDEVNATRLLDIGVERVILGTLAFLNPKIITQIGNAYGFERLVVALDYRNNKIFTDGWRKHEFLFPSEALLSMRSEGICHFLMTSIEKDGLMHGPDMNLINMCGGNPSDIIIAGGVSQLDDVNTLTTAGFEAAIIGRALYEGTISLPEAICKGKRCEK
jgi:phosphoribosylformimino-5-aminoimidazole carboxamide ribotide isomerase